MPSSGLALGARFRSGRAVLGPSRPKLREDPSDGRLPRFYGCSDRTTVEGMTPNRDHEYVLGPDTDAGRELKAAIQREWRRAIEDST